MAMTGSERAYGPTWPGELGAGGPAGAVGVGCDEPAGQPRDGKGRQGLCQGRGSAGTTGGMAVGKVGKRRAVGKVPQLAVGKVPQLATDRALAASRWCW